MRININDLKELKRKYNLALLSNARVFYFKDRDILTTYAKYLIEYLESFIEVKQ